MKVEFLEYLNATDKTILDIGCSTGTCAAQIVDMKNNAYYGIDIEKDYIDIAKRTHKYGKFLAMDARKMNFQDNEFDVVMFIGVLHHMPDDLIADCLSSIQRVLKPEGTIIVAEPVFTKGKYFSNLLLSLDRGRFIRKQFEYKALFEGFSVKRESYFRLSAHRFCSLELKTNQGS